MQVLRGEDDHGEDGDAGGDRAPDEDERDDDDERLRVAASDGEDRPDHVGVERGESSLHHPRGVGPGKPAPDLAGRGGGERRGGSAARRVRGRCRRDGHADRGGDERRADQRRLQHVAADARDDDGGGTDHDPDDGRSPAVQRVAGDGREHRGAGGAGGGVPPGPARRGPAHVPGGHQRRGARPRRGRPARLGDGRVPRRGRRPDGRREDVRRPPRRRPAAAQEDPVLRGSQHGTDRPPDGQLHQQRHPREGQIR